MAEWVTVFLTLVIAVFTFLVWRVYERMAWLTGAMETHSDLQLRIEALRGIHGKPIRLVWWDTTFKDTPTKKEHGQEIDLSTIYISLPREMRRNNPTAMDNLKALFRLP